ncbi:MAG: glyceraldehyde 3-phosphate dehydrogenase NAD-binding domain-containing protein, partial [Candidatus Methanomethylicaceae archaeon]
MNMKKFIAINGFGRIGRLFFRAALENKEFNKKFDVVSINDITDAKTLAFLLKYDSIHRKINANVSYKEDKLIVNDKEINITAIKDPANLPWKDLGVDIVLESTGLFTDRENAIKHINAGAKKVI